MRRPSWLMSSPPFGDQQVGRFSTRLQVENGKPCSAGLDLAIFATASPCADDSTL
ncbi:hypothetical protein [Streptomyces sp. NPDC004266]|uniref:hypothetical protein n=1 Tax=Streptomyces sp. NPDC004266 TaxID=3364693 RepID=UPI0036C94763